MRSTRHPFRVAVLFISPEHDLSELKCDTPFGGQVPTMGRGGNRVPETTALLSSGSLVWRAGSQRLHCQQMTQVIARKTSDARRQPTGRNGKCRRSKGPLL